MMNTDLDRDSEVPSIYGDEADGNQLHPHAEEEKPNEPRKRGCCSFLGEYPVTSVLGFAAVGICFGVGLSVWDDSGDGSTKETVLQWVGLVGDLFLRALQAVVLPLVFVNVVLAIVDMMSMGQAAVIGGKMIGFYILTTALATVVAMAYILVFQNLFQEGDFDEVTPPAPTMQLGCGESGGVLSYGPDGSVKCTTNATDAGSTFVVQSVDGMMGEPAAGASLSDTLYAGVFERLVTRNIVASFLDANFAALVVFAIIFGVALSYTVVLPLRQQQQRQLLRGQQEEPALMKLLKELDRIFSLLIMWVLSATPFAVLSLLASTIGSQDDLLQAFQNIALLVVAVVLAMATHVVLVYGGLYTLITRSNPASYFQHLLPAQTTVFASASSVASIPVTLLSVQNTEKVPTAVSRFVIPLGATINMDGGAIYFPIACIWLAVLNGMDVSAGDYVLLVILATVGSAGTASVPAASLVLIISAYNTVFGTTGAPHGFSFILAMDWFLDRLRATMNVTGDAVVCGLVAHTTRIASSTEAGDKSSETGATDLTTTVPVEEEVRLTPEVVGAMMSASKRSLSRGVSNATLRSELTEYYEVNQLSFRTI